VLLCKDFALDIKVTCQLTFRCRDYLVGLTFPALSRLGVLFNWQQKGKSDSKYKQSWVHDPLFESGRVVGEGQWVSLGAESSP
jgi:hypothetical protein